MNSDAARVDVVIPAYNAERYITSALESVAAQTHPEIRIIVSDDGSTDDTAREVRAFIGSHPNIDVQYLRHANAGPAAARNRALEVVRAEYVAFLDADDVWLPEKLKQQLSLFNKPGGESLGLVYCDFELIDDEGNLLPNTGFRLDPTMRGDVYDRLLHGNLIAGSASAALIPSRCLAAVGKFDEALVCAEDWDLWLRLARLYKFDFIPEPLVRLRQHPANAQRDEVRMLGGEILFADKLYRSSHLSRDHIWRLRRRLALGGIDARRLQGFYDCHPAIRRAFSGWRMATLGILILSFHGVRSVAAGIRKLLRGEA